MLKTALKNLKTVIGDRDVNIYVNILGPNADDGIDEWKTKPKSIPRHLKTLL